jgi:hypothetical protein
MYNAQVQQLAVDLLTQQTDRDKQKKVGASQISDPCTYHLAMAMVLSGDSSSKYWLGAKIGTGVHMLLEDAVEKADRLLLPQLEGAIVEKKIRLGEIDGYGVISSKPDLMLPVEKHLIDWKTTTRAKSVKLKKFIDGATPNDAASEYTIMKYTAQTQLYGWGMMQEGIEVENLSLVFINRDGTMESDVWAHTFAYDEDFAVSLWKRLEALWGAIQSGADLEEFDRHPECFRCKVGI